MRIMMACLLLAGCANYPADLLGQPLDEAISLYGKPVTAFDYQGARAFFFQSNKNKTQKIQRTKELLNPDMPITNIYSKPQGCFYTFNALWTSSTKDWIIHSVSESPNCSGSK